MPSNAPDAFLRPRRLSDDEGGYTVLVVALPEEPRERWAYRIEFRDGEPFFTHLHYSATQPERDTARRRATTFHPPVARLVGVWCLSHGLDIDGTPSNRDRNLWDGVSPGVVAGFTRAPDPRPYGGDTSDAYADAMDKWTEPIADTLDLAATIGLSDVRAVELRFGVSRSVAKKHATRARQWNRRYKARTPSPRTDSSDASPQESPELWGTDPATWADGSTDPRTPEWGGPKTPDPTPGRGPVDDRKRKRP